jgi:hypothetical protein
MMGCSTLDIYNPSKNPYLLGILIQQKVLLNKFQYELHEDANIVHYKMCDLKKIIMAYIISRCRSPLQLSSNVN